MKEQTLLTMKNKVESLTNVIQHMLQEMNTLRDLSVGTLETLKLMPDYDKALEKLKENLIESQKKEKEPELKLEQDENK
tara:strand:- start:536 stop:772 length:237 start_codon:yes stop_codon:yes gene_type:complete